MAGAVVDDQDEKSPRGDGVLEKSPPTLDEKSVRHGEVAPSSPRPEHSIPSETTPTLYTLGQDGEEETVTADDPRIKEIPEYVRRVLSFTDDTTLPTITFRYFILTFLFITPGAFLSQMSHFRTTYAPYSVFFVQIASSYVGVWLEKILPAWTVRIPFAKFEFSLNPGPFSVKEHVLVTISAASGAIYNLGYVPLSMSELYFGERVNPAVGVFFMWGIVWCGYSYAALARQFLIHDPAYPWFQSVCQTALFETQKKSRENPTRLSRKQIKVFFLTLLGVTLWQFLPEYAFPMTGSLAFLCWVAPRNPIANFVGAGFGGMSFLNLSLDWSSLSPIYNLFITPWWTQVIIFVAFAVNCWILLPAAKWGGLGKWHHRLMSNRVFTQDSNPYPITDLLSSDMTLNETAYRENGQIFVGTQFLWATFFDYASYTSALVWMALFGYPSIKEGIQKYLERRRSRGGKKDIADQYTDQLNILQRAYPDIPLWWFVAVFLAQFVILVTIIAKGLLFIPIWTYLVAIGTGALVVVPLGWLYALSNFQLAIGTTNELLYGLMINAVHGHKNPCGASTYGSIAGDAWYRAQTMLQDMKIGHYMHIPPRDVFFSQLFGSFLGIPVNYAVIRWVLDTKAEYLTGDVVDPTHQWTGQSLASYLSLGVQYVLIGPRRLFAENDLFQPLPYGFLAGAFAPVLFYALHRSKFLPQAKWRLWNTTIFFSTMSTFFGNISTGYTSAFIGGFVVMYWAYRYRHEVWVRYNYILAAAFDAGFNFNMLLIFLCFGAAKVVVMPNWWGNEEASSDRCFGLPSDE